MYLSKKDQNVLFGNGPQKVSSIPMIERQGNGNFTGFMLNKWSDGTETRAEFIVNARSRDEVVSAYNQQ